MMQSYNPNQHFEVQGAPPDSISQLAWCPTQDILAAGSWNGEVRVWEVRREMDKFQAFGKSSYNHGSPVLCVTMSQDGKVFSGGCDTTAKFIQLGASMGGVQPQQIAKHDAPIKTIECISSINAIMTGSWDKTLRYWDVRQPKQIAQVSMPERVYCTSATASFAVIGCADRSIQVIDFRNPTTPVKKMESPLRYQTRCLALFPDNQGFAVGSIEGRVAIQYFQENIPIGQKNFAFKCHREQNDIYAVNSISFHPTYITFSTAGSDGSFHFWDKDSKQRLAQFKRADAPVTSGVFNCDGSIYAYALSYDWSKGSESFNKNYGSHILLHHASDKDIKGRKAMSKGFK
jgi:mRNA export factor